MSADNPTASILLTANSKPRRWSMVPSFNGLKATFSQMRMLSNRADCWNSMPIRPAIESRSRVAMPAVSMPAIRMLPESGAISPTTALSKTVLPLPEGPMMTTDSPSSTSRSTPSRTAWPSKLLRTPASLIMGPFGLAGQLASSVIGVIGHGGV